MKLKDNLNTVYIVITPVYAFVCFIKGRSFHHSNGPAEINNGGTKKYRINGNLYNEKGAAVIFPSGKRRYYLGFETTKTEWLACVNKMRIKNDCST